MTGLISIKELAIAAAVAVADAPFAELEAQSTHLAELALDGFLTKQQAVDVARTAAVAAGLVHRYGEDVVQEAIGWGVDRALEPVEAPPLAPVKVQPREYRPPQATIDAFWYVVRNEDRETLKRWIAEHPKDAPFLRKLWEAKSCRQST